MKFVTWDSAQSGLNLYANHTDSRAAEHWKSLVGIHFSGPLKPPFNDSARNEAGLTREYYADLA